MKIVSACECRVRRQAWPQQQTFPQERRTFRFPNPSVDSDSPGRFPRPPNDFRTDGTRSEGGGNENGGRQNGSSGTTTTTPAPRRIHVSPPNCSCPSTPQFNPVCGTDGNTYKNAGLLNCYRQCGTDVAQRRLGVC